MSAFETVRVFREPITNRRCGEIRKNASGELYYFSPRNRREHYCRKYKGWGISRFIVDELINNDIEKIILCVDGNDITMNLKQFMVFAIEDSLGRNEKQLFVAEKRWHSCQ